MAVMQVNIPETTEQLVSLIDRAIKGEEITLAKDGIPAVRLVPVQPAKKERILGMDRDSIWIADDFDAPLPPDILAGFLGEDPPPVRSEAKPETKTKIKGRKKK